MFLPSEYNKARRNVTKLVNSYFNVLKDEIKLGVKMNLDRSKIVDIEDAITSYIGLRYNDRPFKLDLKLKPVNTEESKNKESRGCLLSYLPESEKIVNFNHVGKMTVKEIKKG